MCYVRTSSAYQIDLLQALRLFKIPERFHGSIAGGSVAERTGTKEDTIGEQPKELKGF